ncbi:MAG TPA: UDP-N-acetylmuramoyl-tripeptide--D-alanyl-D-alanine ligase [Phycisphaerales bacterium]|nr:UDP-N-acetylmuramoyl-tripeptide--D-alanyl-D-alanine ligase [Phycisphaerales bacterium]
MPITGLCTDNRSATPGCLFAAVRGDRHDGHDYAAKAAEAGAAVILASRPITGVAAPVLVVEDVRRALGRFAAAYRDHLGAQGAVFIAVCGSNGKTTTVRLIDSVLRTTHPGTSSQKSFNNDLGVPLTILAARPGDHFVLCEVGTNHPGEIDRLGRIVRPDIAVITSIGREHLEGFGDLAGVMREEGSIAGHLRPNGTLLYAEAPAFAPPDTRTFEGLLETFTNPFSSRCLDKAYWLRRVQPVEVPGAGGAPTRVGVQWKDLNGHVWRVPLAGEHNAANAMLAVWVAQAMGLENDVIAAGLLNAESPAMRQQVTVAGQVTIVNDAYNANPDSMLASLAAFPHLAPGAQRRVAVLGQMGELGAAAQAAHAEVLAAALASPGIGAVVVVGPSFAEAAAGAPPGALLAVEPSMSDEAAQRIATYVKPGDAVLIKGSRSQAMERVAAAVTARFAASKAPPLRPVSSPVGPVTGRERAAP